VERVAYQNEFVKQVASTQADRLLVNLHGIFIKVVVTGELGWLDFSQGLVVLASSVTLFAVVRVLMDCAATQTRGRRGDEYRGMKFDDSRDFHTDKEEINEMVNKMIGSDHNDNNARENFATKVMHNDAHAMEVLACMVWEHHHEHEHHDDKEMVSAVKKKREWRIVSGLKYDDDELPARSPKTAGYEELTKES
jgi:hypothetical protein